ncbi:MAG: GGDEF domain-containing protein [Candidatus Melainabacteria bacterium]
MPPKRKNPAPAAPGLLRRRTDQSGADAVARLDEREEKALRSRLALAAGVRQGSISEEHLDQLLKAADDPTHYQIDLVLREVECARALNFDVSADADLVATIEQLETAVSQVTGTRKNLLLLFEEETGVYTCLNDEKAVGARPRELTRISDDFLGDFIGSEQTLHVHLIHNNTLVGLLAVAEKTNGLPFYVVDEITLELLAPYLASKLLAVQALKKAIVEPFYQRVVNEAAVRLVSAVDAEHILINTLDLFRARLGFEVCQYVALHEDGSGVILYENVNGKLKSYAHAGLEGKRQIVGEFIGIVSMLASGLRQDSYLHLSGGMLGERKLSEIFKVKNSQSAIILPVVDLKTGQIQGTLNLFHTTPVDIPKENLAIASEIARIVAQALTRARVLEKALAMATIDELTGLMNRRGLYERFEAEIERARRHPTPICVALMDVDHFKTFNDTYGHLTGDALLRQLGELLSGSVRRSDVVCRFGGEEFAIMLPDTEEGAAVDLMERLRALVADMTVTGENGEQLNVTISIGLAAVALAPGSEKVTKSVISETLAAADSKLYEAKHGGRNRLCH